MPRRRAVVRVPRAKVALSTASMLPEPAGAAFEMAAALGYDGVEVMVTNDPVSQDGAVLRRLSAHYGIPVLSVHAPCLLLTQAVWGRDPWAKLARACDLARTVGAGTVVVHPPFRWQAGYARAFVTGLLDLEDRSGLTLAVENMYPWRAGQRTVLAYSPGYDPSVDPYPHLTLDVSHAATANEDALAMAAAYGERLAHLHLADGSGSARDEHLPPGWGTQPCAELLGWLAETDFAGTVVVEVSTRACRTRQGRERALAESLAFARLHLAASATGQAGGGR